jgi:hypothetical protein
MNNLTIKLQLSLLAGLIAIAWLAQGEKELTDPYGVSVKHR